MAELDQEHVGGTAAATPGAAAEFDQEHAGAHGGGDTRSGTRRRDSTAIGKVKLEVLAGMLGSGWSRW